jgi:hypothetical protein
MTSAVGSHICIGTTANGAANRPLHLLFFRIARWSVATGMRLESHSVSHARGTMILIVVSTLLNIILHSSGTSVMRPVRVTSAPTRRRRANRANGYQPKGHSVSQCGHFLSLVATQYQSSTTRRAAVCRVHHNRVVIIRAVITTKGAT